MSGISRGRRKRGLLITLDGVDGVGKSTQVRMLCEHLTSLGLEPLSVRDPGSTAIGQRLRAILLESEIVMHRRTEAMLFMASRCEMVEAIVRPALAAGRVVVCDRFLLANVVYQSVGGDVDPSTLWQLGRLANADCQPDLTLLLDMPAARAMERLQRDADRMESRGIEYLEAVRQAFLEQLPNSGGETRVISADRPTAKVHSEVAESVDSLVRR